jgi:hypothetical protein
MSGTQDWLHCRHTHKVVDLLYLSHEDTYAQTWDPFFSA